MRWRLGSLASACGYVRAAPSRSVQIPDHERFRGPDRTVLRRFLSASHLTESPSSPWHCCGRPDLLALSHLGGESFDGLLLGAHVLAQALGLLLQRTIAGLLLGALGGAAGGRRHGGRSEVKEREMVRAEM